MISVARRPGRVPRARSGLSSALALAFLLLLLAGPTTAQSADFLFKRPALTLSVMGGWAMPGESSDLFETTRAELTVDRGDFAAPSFMVEAGIRLTERLDLAVGVELVNASVRSEMQDYVTVNDAPIPQTTEFKRRRLMVSGKAYLFERGRQISRFAWIPTSWSPYVGGGVGVTWYEFIQHGDFVDFQTLDIFEARLQSDGRGSSRHVLAGFDVTLAPSWLLRAEYRYIWGRAPVDQFTFQGFEDIDLSGGRATLGFAVRM